MELSWLSFINIRFGDLGGVLGSCLEPVGITFFCGFFLSMLFSRFETSNIDVSDSLGPVKYMKNN